MEKSEENIIRVRMRWYSYSVKSTGSGTWPVIYTTYWWLRGKVVKNLPASAGDAGDPGSILGSRRSPEEGNGNPPQYSYLGSPMDRGASVSSVQFSYVWLCSPLDCSTPGLSITNSRTCSNSCSSSQWCHPSILSPVIPFSSCLQSFPASGSFPRSQFFAWGGLSIGVSASASVLPMNIQDWFPLGWTSLLSLQSKWFSRVYSSTTVQKHQFFSTQALLFNSHIHTWPLEKP